MAERSNGRRNYLVSSALRLLTVHGVFSDRLQTLAVRKNVSGILFSQSLLKSERSDSHV